MKIYTAEYDFNRPTTKSITVPTNTEYKIGIAAFKDGNTLELTQENVTIDFGNNKVLQPSGTYNGYVTFDYSQGRNPVDEIAKVKIRKQNISYDFELKIEGKYSTKGDISDTGRTALFEGEYDDGSSFSMNVYIAD